MIGFSFLGSVPAANRKRLKTEAGGLQEVGTFSPVMSRAPFHCLNTIEKLWVFLLLCFFIEQCFEISRNWSSLLPTITHACSRICFFISTLSQRKFQKTKGGLFFHDNVWHGASPLITRTHLCDDERFCHPVQSSKLSFGSPLGYGISLAFFLNPPSSLCFFCS